MKAFLLSAGIGSRLKPLTDSIPKCLIEINNKPTLYWWFKYLKYYGINEVLINTHHLSEKVVDFIKTVPKELTVNLVYEPELLGSAGTIKKNFDFIKNDKDFFVFYSDVLTNFNLNHFYNFHITNKKIASIALFKSDFPESCGIVDLDSNHTVINFVEKPKNPKSNLANAGIYLFKPDIFDFLPKQFPADIGFNLLPKLTYKTAGWFSSDFIIDIGTFEKLDFANLNWKNNINFI